MSHSCFSTQVLMRTKYFTSYEELLYEHYHKVRWGAYLPPDSSHFHSRESALLLGRALSASSPILSQGRRDFSDRSQRRILLRKKADVACHRTRVSLLVCIFTCAQNSHRLPGCCFSVCTEEGVTAPSFSGSRTHGPRHLVSFLAALSAVLLSVERARRISLHMSLPVCGKFCFPLTSKDCRCRYVVIGGREPSTALVQPILETVRRWVPTCFAKLMTCPGIGYPEEWKEAQPGSWHLASSPGTTDKLIQTWPSASYSAALLPGFANVKWGSGLHDF